MEIEIELRGQKLEVAFIGELTETHSIALADRILNLCPSQIPSEVEINLRSCKRVCSQGIGALVSFRLSPQICGSVTRIAGQDPETERHMRALKLDRLFEFEKEPNATQEFTP
jgi:anti-anti-sigma regulatory factor